MKKLLILVAVFSLGAFNMNAQEVRLGVKGGINFSSFSGDGFDAFGDTKGRTSFQLGGFAEIPVTGKFWIQPEVLYSGQGYDIQSNDDADDVEFQLDYINVPVMAKYYIVEGLYAEVGPQIGFNVKSEVDSDPDDQDSGDFDLDDDAFNTVDFSVGFGTGYRFNNGFGVGARYNVGLSDVFNNEKLLFKSDAKNALLAITASYSF